MMLLWKYCLQTTIILSASLCSLPLLRKKSAAVRHGVLSAALVSAALTPLFNAAMPAWNVSSVVSHYPAVAPMQEQISLIASPATRTLRNAAHPKALEPANSLLSRMPSITWLSGSLIGLIVFVTGVLRLVLVSRAARALKSDRWATVAAAISHEYRLKRAVKLLESKNPAILVTWGVIRSEVILPAGAAEWADDRVCIVLRHELAHIRRSDWIVQIIGQAVRIIFWFNPVIWIVCRRLRLESECACDDAVLSQAIEGHEYAGHLLELARTLNRSGGAWSAALAMSRPSTIERRFSAMLDPSINRQPISRRALLTSLSLGLGLTLCLSIAKAGASVRPSTVTAAAPVVIEQGKVAAPVEPQPAAEPGTAAPVRVQREVQPTSVPASVAVAAPVIPVEPQQAPANVSTPGPVRRRNREADWALFEAAEHGRNSEIDALIREGANVNAALHGDGSPLIAAAREGRLNTVQMLLDRGADPNLAVPGDGSPLIAAAREGYLDVARLLLDRGANPNLSVAGDGNPLILAAAEGHADIVTLLLDRAANINEIVYGDENPLIRASAEGRLDVVRLLVNRKADVNARVWIEPEPWRPNGEWRTPLSEARKRGHQDVVQFLLSVGAKE